VKALVVHPPAAGAEVTDVPAALVAAGQVGVDILECGICGTDVDIVGGKYGTAPKGQSYLILGHENLGVVREVAPDVKGFVPGDLVVATVRRGCGIDRFCLSNRSDFCETGLYTERGIKERDGYVAEQYVEIPQYLVRVPASLRPIAVLLEPLSVVEKAVLEGQRVLDRKEPTPEHPRKDAPKALVAGTGAIGMLASLVLRVRGYDVVTIDRHGETTTAARLLTSIGARHVNTESGITAVGDVQFDMVVEATGSVALDFSLFTLLGQNGVLVLTGIPDASAPPSTVQGGALWRQVVLENEAIVGSVNANRTYFEAGIADLDRFEQQFPGAVNKLITERLPVDQFSSVLLQRTGSKIKSVLQFPNAAK
jgi:glucose 1-dehydrogenase